MASISRMLRALALELGVVVVALSQLNKDGGVRESQAIIQDAVILLNIGEGVIWVEKNRNGSRNFPINAELNTNTLSFRETD